MKSALIQRQYQTGAGLIYWIVCIAVVAFIATFLIRVVPFYLDNRLIQTGLKALVKDGDRLHELNDEEIRKRLYNFYNINNIRSNAPNKGLSIDRTRSDRVIVKVDYEERVAFFANIELLLTFENHLDSSLPDFCCRPKAKLE